MAVKCAQRLFSIDLVGDISRCQFPLKVMRFLCLNTLRLLAMSTNGMRIETYTIRLKYLLNLWQLNTISFKS
ncbi:hypothetical protein XNC3_1640018 [Xenorhabdus nematophila F1]|nr:hypothetical protein XNC3_1640018 [Xenorhabdus nematophila F1]